MAVPRASTSWPPARLASLLDGAAPASLALALGLPLLLLHVHYQPDLGFGLSDTHVDVSLSDLTVLALALVALAVCVGRGAGALRRGLPVWLAAALFLGVLLLSVSYPVLRDQPYDWRARLVSALKVCEYAALALAVPLLLRARPDTRLVLRAFVTWSAVSTLVGLLQFTGAVDTMGGNRPGEREPALLGFHDFAVVSVAALAIAAVALLTADRSLLGARWEAVALVAGGLGLVLSGAMTGVIGMWLAVGVVGLVAWRAGLLRRRAAVIVATAAAAATLGTAAMRGSALSDFAAFLGIHRNETPGAVESYSQRTLLSYIGLKIFWSQPVTGVGFQGSSDLWAYGPVLPDAHRRFPGQPAEAFPSPSHPWGVQNLYVESLADFGLIGAAALVGLFGTALAVGLRAAGPSALVGVAWLLAAIGVWIGLGIVPGIPLAAVTWLAFGLACSRA